MRKAMIAALLLGACAQPDAYQQAKSRYVACLGAKPAEQCTNERARLDVEAQSVRLDNERPIWQPQPVRTGMNCTAIGPILSCN